MDSSSKAQKANEKKPCPEVLMRQNSAELFKHFAKLLCFQEALYHPSTKQKLFILDAGICLRGDCSVKQTIHRAKVLLPESSRYQFGDKVSASLIGTKVVCFAHFEFYEQMHYILHGSFPSGTAMLQKNKATTLGPRVSMDAINNDVSWVRLVHKMHCAI